MAKVTEWGIDGADEINKICGYDPNNAESHAQLRQGIRDAQLNDMNNMMEQAACMVCGMSEDTNKMEGE